MSTRQTILSPDTILLLALGTAHLWFSQISSAILVILLALYVLLDLIDPPTAPQNKRWLFLLRLGIIFFAVLFAAILPTGYSILQRQLEGPATNANDGLIQTEVAVQFLLDGKNPYSEDYTNTILADWRGGEPPFTPIPGILHHNVYLPFLFLVSIPPYWLSMTWLGWYDQRLLYLLFYLATLLLLPLLVRQKREQLALMTLIGLNFLFAFFLADGRNDVVILFGLVLTTALLARGYEKTAVFTLALTLLTKHQAWLFLPFFLVYLAPRKINGRFLPILLQKTWLLYPTLLAILLPFLLWDASAFYSDTISYIIGTSPYSFPIRGIGISHLLVTFGLIPSYDAPFPFLLLSLPFSLAALFWGIRRQWGDNSLANLWLGFAIFAFTFQFFSRFFNDNYFIFTLQALFIALYLDPPASLPVESKQEHLL
ncbi:MAG: hypothetical protein KDE56_19910 [Anaerolineales bacterium]|nr:hypothetical protein [Anaerolineales bacterium]